MIVIKGVRRLTEQHIRVDLGVTNPQFLRVVGDENGQFIMLYQGASAATGEETKMELLPMLRQFIRELEAEPMKDHGVVPLPPEK